MRVAIQLSIQNVKTRKGGPFGAVIVKDGKIIAQGVNSVTSTNDPTAHAEMVAIREACAKLNRSRLDGYDLYVTLEPCAMCASAISHAHLDNLYFGAYDLKAGAVDHHVRFFESKACLHRPDAYGGILEKDCGQILSHFFSSKR
ncbi:MAG: nucleoside deaminase [Alphaproteobacteria bacterium]|nr:nucleoside deaminase [Alphaproteobacteria bacterium]